MLQPVFLFNNVTKQLQKIEDTVVNWYCCGPTIYDSAHLGHASTYVNFDTIRRVLEYFGYTVNYCMNITDVDDKIQKKLKETGMSHQDLIDKYESDFRNDMKLLNVRDPNTIIRVSENIPLIQDYILQIMKNGLAYVSNSSVYIDSKEYINRGLEWDIFNRCTETANEGIVNVSVSKKNTHNKDKKHPKDFCLWKACNQNDVVGYPSGIFGIESNGKPGWHIECSAMSNKLFPKGMTIHSGGIDLIYPHHNNECVQNIAHGTFNIPIFIHTGHLHINETKMSKSLKNTVSIKDALQKATPRVLRLLFLMHNYDKQLNYSDEIIQSAKDMDDILSNYISLIKKRADHSTSYNTQVLTEETEKLYEFKNKVETALATNINTKNALRIIVEYLAILNKIQGKNKDGLNYILSILSVLGLEYNTERNEETKDVIVDLSVLVRNEIRNVLKSFKKDTNSIPKLWSILDGWREELSTQGIIVEDIGNESTWRYDI